MVLGRWKGARGVLWTAIAWVYHQVIPILNQPLPCPAKGTNYFIQSSTSARQTRVLRFYIHQPWERAVRS
ncbi:hypothetical protein I7I50_09677 [Histoplasma capsulatum G186AR]|uniref:Uncharacterized protein n=1 Tax=Ajellomyces capsulatus TaxID=5037 RepID=A0A8H7YVP8_AJECA|nr:hypothetical protein I7I52_07207 [Histoplasma capsulatum]QSS74472.1 hypothetical protein I7I50_09677 [Histoplasma capsulatum G186AR]